MKPAFTYSIVTATLNGGEFLPRAVEALRAQSYERWEMLVQDGGSSDGGPEFLAGLRDDRIKTVSEPDSGVYDAWNKALARAEGEWILFLGADDHLADAHVLARAARTLTDLGPEILFAQAGLHLGKAGRVRDTVARSKAEIFMFFISGMPLMTPAVFFRRALFAGGDSFDPSYSIAGDFAFVAPRLRPDNLALLPFVSTYMESGGLSSSVKTRPLLDAERLRILREIIRPMGETLVQYRIDTYGDTRNPLRS